MKNHEGFLILRKGFLVRELLLFISINLLFMPQGLTDTLVGGDFYGQWSTTNSYLKPERQILDINKDQSNWIRIGEDGEFKIVKLDSRNIDISDDVLTFSYRDKERKIEFKFIFSGWKVGDDKRMFGTVYLYQYRIDKYQLFNAYPVSYENGVDKIPNQVFWRYFRAPKLEKVDVEFIINLERDLKEIADIEIVQESLWVMYHMPTIEKSIFISRASNPVHPAAIGYFGFDENSNKVQVSSKYTGNESEFKKYESEFKSDMNLEFEQVLDTLKETLKSNGVEVD
jgi:hypothetical protein